MEIPTKKIIGVQFGILSPDEIRNLSVVEIKTHAGIENGKMVDDGLYDPRMGVITSRDECKTCKLNGDRCPGHFGHLELAKPVYNIEFINFVKSVLDCICFRCGKILIEKKYYNFIKTRVSVSKRLRYVVELSKTKKECEYCESLKPSYKIKDIYKIFYTFKDENTEKVESNLPAEYVLELFKRLEDEDVELLGMDPKISRPEWMILTALPVPPPSMRPSVRLEENSKSEDDLYMLLVGIIRSNNELRKKLISIKGTDKKEDALKYIDSYIDQLTYYVSSMYDDKVRNIAQQVYSKTKKPLKTIKERLSGKGGRIRGNIMGKRVDYYSRTVISPDINLNIDELGVPFHVAKIITIDEYVTEKNINEMYIYVRNGDKIYPGAYSVIHGNKKHVLKFMKQEDLQNIVLYPGDIVKRHMKNGDITLFNRQPSLHKLSVMAFKITVLPPGNNTFRFNTSVCPSFNADFDGKIISLPSTTSCM